MAKNDNHKNYHNDKMFILVRILRYMMMMMINAVMMMMMMMMIARAGDSTKLDSDTVYKTFRIYFAC